MKYDELQMEDLAEAMSRGMSEFSNVQAFIKVMGCQHRTLQQVFTKVCVAWLEELGKLPEGWYDLRNEASVKLGREFLEKVDPVKRLLPFI